MMRYPSKILLFGEYSVIKGSDALAVPFPKYGGAWAYADSAEAAREKQAGLPAFAEYLAGLGIVDAGAFKRDLEGGLYFDSDIPQGYGAGSSGALCAAVYAAYAERKTGDSKALKSLFATMEGFFHGESSGFDPLVSYLGKAVRLSGGTPTIPDTAPDLEGLFLVDTGIARSTAPLVEIFLSKCQDPAYEQACQTELRPLADAAIDDCLRGDGVSLFHRMHDLSRFQYLHFQEMIPPPFKNIWAEALRSPHTKLKLCGAGGGGFLMGMSRNAEKTHRLLNGSLLSLANV